MIGSPQRPRRLLDQLREKIRIKHYSIRTEQAYVDWARRYILFHGKRYPCQVEAPELEVFLTHLAVDRNVSASTQNQACSALLFIIQGGFIDRIAVAGACGTGQGCKTVAGGIDAAETRAAR